jgi:hypothetical protein
VLKVPSSDASAGRSLSRIRRARPRAAEHDLSAQDPDQIVSLILATFPNDEFELAQTQSIIEVGATGVAVTVRYTDGSQKQAVVPIGGPVSNSKIGKLQFWITNAGFLATQAILQPRWIQLTRDFADNSVRSVSLDMLGCYGSCQRYSALFSASGTAELQERGPTCRATASARVPFARILDIAKRSGASRLLPLYSSYGTDSEGARISIDTPSGSYQSVGPDRSRWDPAFIAMQSRLDELVSLTKWSPAVDHVKCGESKVERAMRAPHGTQ